MSESKKLAAWALFTFFSSLYGPFFVHHKILPAGYLEEPAAWYAAPVLITLALWLVCGLWSGIALMASAMGVFDRD